MHNTSRLVLVGDRRARNREYYGFSPFTLTIRIRASYAPLDGHSHLRALALPALFTMIVIIYITCYISKYRCSQLRFEMWATINHILLSDNIFIPAQSVKVIKFRSLQTIVFLL